MASGQIKLRIYDLLIAQDVSLNTWMVSLLAGGAGFKLPQTSVVDMRECSENSLTKNRVVVPRHHAARAVA